MHVEVIRTYLRCMTSTVSERSRHRLKGRVIVPDAAAIPGSTVTVGVGSPFIAPLYQGLLRRAALTGVCPGFGRCPRYNHGDWSMHFSSSVLYWEIHISSGFFIMRLPVHAGRRFLYVLLTVARFSLAGLSTSVYDRLSGRSVRPAPHSGGSADVDDFQNSVVSHMGQWR